MNIQRHGLGDQSSIGQLPAWLAKHLRETNCNFQRRVVNLPEYARWLPTRLDGVQMRVLEFVPGVRPRLAAQLRFSHTHTPASLENNPGMELLIQRGELSSEAGNYPSGSYFRLPGVENSTLDAQRFRSNNDPDGTPPLLYVAAGQMAISDIEPRRIDTLDEERWLPGPNNGTEVLPLHGHGTENVMLIRWTGTSAFKPRIDPQGEEILVLQGMVHDSFSTYTAGTWIRNPVKAWQSWGARAGTVVYYKNGHFVGPSFSA